MNESKFKYSVLTYNIGGYEVLHELEYKDEDVEYIYVTDDRSITSSTWNVVYVENEHPEDNFDLCYQIRFHPFEYVSSDIVIRIDGSMGVCGNLDHIIDAFNKGGYEIALELHPTRATMYDEYLAWVQQRNYPIEQANKCLAFMLQVEGYNVKEYKGLYQYNFMIQRRNKVNLDINRMTLSLLKYLAPEGKQIERIDQTIGSFVINKYFNGLKVLPVSQSVCTTGTYFRWYAHGSNTPLSGNSANFAQPYLFNQPIDCVWVGE
jgi:hypothetical protein